MHTLCFALRYSGLAFIFVICAAAASEESSRTFLRPLGEIAQGQHAHLLWVLLLMAAAVIPVFIATPWIYFRYRYGKTNTYQPDWSFNRYLEFALWGVPAIIVLALSVHLWQSTHEDDPYRKMDGEEPLCVQVIGLNWQWLFLYPQYHTASLNRLVIPIDRPVALQLTSDTVMQSFRISALAGQIYAMPGMQTQLHFSAFRSGSAWGENTQFNGDGFARQHFLVEAVTENAFIHWQQKDLSAMPVLSEKMYANMGVPQPAFTHGKVNVLGFSAFPSELFSRVIARYHSGRKLADEAQPGSAQYKAGVAKLPAVTNNRPHNRCALARGHNKEQQGE